MQKLAKHAEPAASELSDKMEGGAHKFAKHAGPATKEFSDRAIDAAKDLSKNAAPKAHKVGHPENLPLECGNRMGKDHQGALDV